MYESKSTPQAFFNAISKAHQSSSGLSLKKIALGAIFGLLLMYFWPLNTVPTGSRGVITVGGAIRGIENEGFLLLAPWQHLDKFSIRAEQADIENADGSTVDQQLVKVSLTVRYSISPDKVGEVFEKYSHTGDLTSYVQTASQEAFKAVTANYSAPDLISKRKTVSDDINKALGAKLALYGAQVINIDMRNFSFSQSYTDAINDKVTQEQKRLAAENKLKTVESEQKQKVVIAEAEANATKAKADGDAYANLTVAKAQAEALKVQNLALTQSKEVLELRRIEVDMEKAKRWDGKLPQNIYAGAPIPFLSMGKDSK